MLMHVWLVSVLLLKMLKKSELKNNGKLKVPKGLVIKGQGVQDIYGPKADILKSDI